MPSTSPVAQHTDGTYPADRCEREASSSDESKRTEVESKGDGTEMTAQESAMEDAIRLTRSRLKKRIGSTGNGTDSGPKTTK